jgi:hypothetical protein
MWATHPPQQPQVGSLYTVNVGHGAAHDGIGNRVAARTHWVKSRRETLETVIFRPPGRRYQKCRLSLSENADRSVCARATEGNPHATAKEIERLAAELRKKRQKEDERRLAEYPICSGEKPTILKRGLMAH